MRYKKFIVKACVWIRPTLIIFQQPSVSDVCQNCDKVRLGRFSSFDIYIYIYIHTHTYIHTYIHTYLYIIERERAKEREREYTNASSFSWLKCSVVTECNRSLCQQSVCFCEPASLLTILDLHKPCRWVCNNAGSVLKLQVIIGILSLIFYVCTFTCFICGNSWDLRTLWFWKLNKNESLRVLQPLFYLHLTCVNN